MRYGYPINSGLICDKGTGILSYFAAKLEKIGWVFTFGTIAIMFNPLILISLQTANWRFVGLGHCHSFIEAYTAAGNVMNELIVGIAVAILGSWTALQNRST